MKKRVSKILLSLVILFNICAFDGFAEDNISVTLNGEALTFDVPPQLIDNRTMVPLRKIFEAMGAVVDWNNDIQTVTATKGNEKVIATINSKNVYINGEIKILDVPPMVVNDRTMVPVRFVAESFGANVDWNESTRTVIIKTNQSNNVSVFNMQEFIKGFELAEYSKYNSSASENGLGGTKIYFSAVLDKVEVVDTDNSIDAFGGYFTDKDSNKWFGMMSTALTDSLDDYANFKGKDLIVCGIYEGYSEKLKMPVIQLYKMADIHSAAVKTGLAKMMEELDIKTESNDLKTSNGDITKRTDYDFLSTTGIESYLYENYKTLNSDIGKYDFKFEVHNYGYYSEDFCIDVSANGPDLGLLFEYDTVTMSNYSDSEIEKGKEQLKDFMENLAADLIDKIPNKKLTGSYHDSYYRYPKLYNVKGEFDRPLKFT